MGEALVKVLIVSTRRSASEVHAAVISAAQEILAESGVLTFRMADLFQRAGVSESVVYRHFIDRDHLVIESLIAAFESLNEESRRVLPAYLEQIDALDPTPESVAKGLAEWIIGDGSPETLRKQVLRSRLDVAVVEFPEFAERVAALQREQEQMAEIVVYRLRERIGERVWKISSESFGLLLSGLSRALLVRALDPALSPTKNSGDEFAVLLRLMLERFSDPVDGAAQSS